MIKLSLLYCWMSLLGSLAVIAIVLTAIACMLCIVKPADVPTRAAVILGVVILLIMLPAVVVGAWQGMSLWQQIALVAIGVGIWQWKQPLRRRRRTKVE